MMWYSPGIAIYDKAYRLVHGLERPAAQIPPILTVEVRRSMRCLALRDGTRIQAGDRVGALHLDNARLARLHANGWSEVAVGLEFRRAFLTSLRTLADRARAGGPLADVVAFSAVTILHRGLPRIGFERDPRGLTWQRLTTAYQRALLASVNPSVRALARHATARSERLWLPRARLLEMFDEFDPGPADVGRSATQGGTRG